MNIVNVIMSRELAFISEYMLIKYPANISRNLLRIAAINCYIVNYFFVVHGFKRVKKEKINSKSFLFMVCLYRNSA